MKTDNAICVDAVQLLIKGLGEIETERFIYLVKRERFNYTEWQKDLWSDKTIDEVFTLAAEREITRID